MIITNKLKMSEATQSALKVIESIREPLCNKRDAAQVKLNAHLESMKAAKEIEAAIRAEIKEANEALYVVDMDRGAVHKAQGIGSQSATDAAVKAIVEKY